MQNIRKVLGWIFACTSLTYVLIYLRSMHAIGRHFASLTFRNLLIFVLFEVVVAAITGMAWWAILKGEPSERGWGIAASLMYILIFVRPFIFSLGIVWWHHVAELYIGIVGLVTFLGHDKQHDPDPDRPILNE